MVLVTTGFLYIMTVLCLPFSPVYASVFLFALIGFWSRLPGVGIPHPFFILYIADFMDIFSMLIAINVGPVQGAVFALVGNLWSRAVGSWPDWGGVMSDSISQSLTCLVIPYAHVMLGSNILVSMVAYTVIRAIFLIPLDRMGFYPVPWPQYIMEFVVILPVLFLINIFYTKMFGSFFDNLLKEGVAFSWTLFFFATGVILLTYILMYRKRGKKMPSVSKGLKRILSSKKNKKMKKKHDEEIHRVELRPMERVYDGRGRKNS